MKLTRIIDVAKAINGTLRGDVNITIDSITIDSRTISSAKHTLFFAIKGSRHDGHLFISSLYEIGVRAFVVSDIPKDIARMNGASFIVVHVFYNGIDLKEYDSRPFELLYTRQGDEVIIGNAGRLVYQKGQDMLLDAAAILDAHDHSNIKIGTNSIGIELIVICFQPRELWISINTKSVFLRKCGNRNRKQ